MKNNAEKNNADIRKALTQYATEGLLPCKQAFAASDALGLSRAQIGRHADDMGLKLMACQLGLFGYRPEKKIVKPVESIDPAFAGEIRNRLVSGRLSCHEAFEIALEKGVEKMVVSAYCEAMTISIKPCQLGAF